MNAGGLGFLCCGVFVLFVVGILLGGFVVWVSCRLYNRIVGATGRPVDDVDPDDRRVVYRYDDESDDDEEEDERPRPRRTVRTEFDRGPGVPQPSYGKSIGIFFASWAVGVVINGVLTASAGLGLQQVRAGIGAAAIGLLVNVVQFVIGFFILTGMLKTTLPTTFGRACGVSGITSAILLALFCIVFVVAFAVGAGFAGGL
jgi:hypothetical protein